MASVKKFKFTFQDTEFLLPMKSLKTHDYYGKPQSPVIEIGRVEGASMIKQFAKKHYPSIKVSSVSDTFANGNSIDVYLSTKTGEKIPNDDYIKVRDFGELLQMGRFNGMIDLYEYKDAEYKSSKGTRISSYCKWVSVYNEPRFGTVEWCINEVNEGRPLDSLSSYVDKKVIERTRKVLESL